MNQKTELKQGEQSTIFPSSPYQPQKPETISSLTSYKILFWNVEKKDLSEEIGEIANHHKADFILIGELISKDTKKYKAELEKSGYKLRTTSTAKVKIFDRFSSSPQKTVSIPKDDVHYSQRNRITSMIYNINGHKVLLVGIHLFSKASMKRESSRLNFGGLTLDVIKYIEDQHKIDKTIIIGDFNINPFESGMIDFFGMNATMSKNIALHRERIISKQKKRFLFNPSWEVYSKVGELNKPVGTYYFEDTYDTLVPYWNLLDQVLISPNLVHNSLSFEIVSSAGDKVPTLLNEKFLPDAEQYSDHLPILYKIQF
ncbi:hypothetical protein AA0X95_16670 [Bacillus sp. 1P10SD]|uniref:hypothetical protein n=1 Tax=Bacillus sp. 1P10SD TaxID=3132265 RepID=UPI0039A421BF